MLLSSLDSHFICYNSLMEPLHLTCPYCWQHITFYLDPDIEEKTTIIEDCSVCCRPIEIVYTIDEGCCLCQSINPIEGNAF